MRIVTLRFVSNIIHSAARLLAADGMHPWILARLRVLWFLYGTPGPSRCCWRPYRDSSCADFHPSQHDNRPLPPTAGAPSFPLEPPTTTTRPSRGVSARIRASRPLLKS